MPVTVLPNVMNEQLLFVGPEFKPCKRCNDWRKLLIERGDLVAARVVSLKAMHEIKHHALETATLMTLFKDASLKAFFSHCISCTVWSQTSQTAAVRSWHLATLKREALYNILLEFGIPKKLVRLIKMCLNETYSKVHVGKLLTINVLFRMGWNKEMLYRHCFSILL
jgi:hypothetical protein